MLVIRYIFLLIALLSFFKIWAQSPTLQEEGKVDQSGKSFPTKAICVSVGAAYLNFSHGYFTTLNSELFISQRISLDAKYGFSLNKWSDDKREQIYTVGFKYWFSNMSCVNSFSPFVGFHFFGVLVPDYVSGTNTFENYYGMHTIEVPVGISYTTKFGLQTSLQLSYYFLGFSYEDYDWPNVELRVGWRFNFRKRGNR